jgi:tRNA (guanine37-N1)-methyltransferase
VRFTVFTLFPGMFRGFLESSILGKARSRGLLDIRLVDIREFAADRHHVCDDAPYGGGAGMVMKPEPIARALEQSGAVGKVVVYTSPSGRPFRQETAVRLAAEAEVFLLCGRYEGVDQRVLDAYVTEELSVGDYVLSGGEVAAMVIMDAVARLVGGVIAPESLMEESFSEGLLEYPHFTRPEEFQGRKVPEVLLSGHHENIRAWRLRQSVEKTLRNRPELLEGRPLPERIRRLLDTMGNEGKEGEDDGRDEGR